MAMMLPGATTASRSVTILGSTGSVGCSTIDLIKRNPDAYVVEALTAKRNVNLLVEQAKILNPRYVAIGDEEHYHALKADLSGSGIEVAAGPEAIVGAARRPADFVMSAIVGAAGLAPTLAAVNRGAMVGLANKECLVCAGSLMVEEIRRNRAVLLPVDSEHNAIFQVFDFERRDAVDKLILTASGGPFRSFDNEAMRLVTPAQAVAHPNWDMGAKISVDSATMMNKGLEVIEAHWLFGLESNQIDIIVHPQSIIHSMVEFNDSSVKAQMGVPDMKVPIQYVLTYPKHAQSTWEQLDLVEVGQLTFEEKDLKRFPCIGLAYNAYVQVVQPLLF